MVIDRYERPAVDTSQMNEYTLNNNLRFSFDTCIRCEIDNRLGVRGHQLC